MATYLLTGASGFIASRVATFLLEDGHMVIGVDNLNDAYDVRLKQWRLARLTERPNFSFHRLDISDRGGLDDLVATHISSGQPPIDAIVNLAARAGVRQSVENPWVYFETNTTGTLNLLELARRHDIKKFVLASTSSLYGQSNPMPYREDQDTDHPLSPYAASKKAAEVLCHTYHYLYGIDITVFRYFTVYGPAGRPDMSLFRFVQGINEERPITIFGDGRQSRDFTYVDDIARGTIAGLKPLGYEAINLGSDTPVMVLDAIQLVEEQIEKRASIIFKPPHPADVPATWADVAKAERLLGWRPQVTFEEGVTRLVEWYQANHAWAKDIRVD